MSAYVIVEIEVVDPAGFEEYKKQAAATVHQHGGKYIVRGGRTVAFYGEPPSPRIAVMVFESMEKAQAAFNSWLVCKPKN